MDAARLVLLLALSSPAFAHAEAVPARPAERSVPETFAYTTPPDENFVRALLELAGVMSVGFLWYVTNTSIAHDYDVGYSWPVFRSKLLGQAFELDASGFNTNFIGHPIGGTLYYTTARSNRLSVADASAIALGGAVFWEYFGEVHEIVSTNDVIVTPLAGIAIGETMTQLGAFFDRSSPTLHNRILGVVFAPLKSLNDALDGLEPARATQLDEHGFPLDEWHQFDLSLGGAATLEDPPAPHADRDTSYELRLSLASRLVRLPDYDGAGARTLVFSDANVSSMRVDVAFTHEGLVDLDVDTQFVVAGHSYRRASYDARGGLWGQGTLVGVTMGYQYAIHDYDRDRVRHKDGVSTVQPLGVLLEHRAALGRVRVVTAVSGGADFGGVRPYAQDAYVPEEDAAELPIVVTKDRYCFAVGGHVLASVSAALAPFELTGKLRYESYSGVGLPIDVRDHALSLEARAGYAVGSSPARVTVSAQRRARSGRMDQARAARGETSLGVELGVRY